MFLVPYSHDRMSVRRLPWVSIALIVANLLSFLAVRGDVEGARVLEEQALRQVVAFWVEHPFVEFTPEFAARYPKPISGLRGLVKGTWEPPPAGELADQQREFAALQARVVAAADGGPYRRWGFSPGRPTLATLLTHQFVHAGWGHLLGNLLFLYLSAPFIEDLWGRVLFPLFYLLGGAAAAGAQALRHPDSLVPLVGASGAIAAVMGAFLVRRAFARIRFFYAWFFVGMRWGTFDAPAWLMLPLWLLSQFFYDSLQGGPSGVAYWAHIGGFAFGAAFAGAMKWSGFEDRFIRPEIEAATSAYGDPRIDAAAALRDEGRHEEALAAFEALLRDRSAAAPVLDGAFTSALALDRREEASRRAGPMLEGWLRVDNTAMALERYEEILRRLPGLVLPARVLYAVATRLARERRHEEAAEAARCLAEQHPADLLALKALVAGAREAFAAGRGEEAREMLAAAGAHPLATGEWPARIAAAAQRPRAGRAEAPPAPGGPPTS